MAKAGRKRVHWVRLGPNRAVEFWRVLDSGMDDTARLSQWTKLVRRGGGTVSQEELHLGQIVKLKSGGPEMTVQSKSSSSEGVRYWCQWFAGKKLERGVFSRQSLELIEPEEE